jgi:hypothetical protein
MYLHSVYPENLAMWKHNLTRQLSKLWPHLRISAFILVWIGLFHSLTLNLLVYWSLTSSQVPELARITTLNQFWAENQILFAALCGLSGSFFFKGQLQRLFQERQEGVRWLLIHALRGFLFTCVILTALIVRGRYEFLGLSTQLNLNFLSSYAWFFRAVLLFLFVFSTEFLTRRVLQGPVWLRVTTQVLIYWIWFFPSWGELLSIGLLSLLFSSFWAATGFTAAIFISSHAWFGLPFFENEFSGILQIKYLKADETLLQNPYLQITLLVLLFVFRYAKLLFRKEPLAS